MAKNPTQPPKGFRDFLPQKMRLRQYVLDVCRQVFESFGFEPLATPAVEYASTLLNKYGQEADRLVYTFKDRGGRQLGLRYDLTVPVSRVLAQYRQQLTLPFKRYQIQPVWRAEKPQRGRFREFIQCDADIFGISSPLADAEVVALIYTLLKRLNLKNFVIQINSRQVLFTLLKAVGISETSQQLSVLQTIDKLEKQGKTKVVAELKEKGLSSTTVDQLFKTLSQTQPDANLKKLFDYLKDFGVPSRYYRFTPTLVRGLDYYTGPIFETVLPDVGLGSITGGGRYDRLVAQLGGPDTPATGTTIGFDRLCQLIEEQNLLPSLPAATSQILIAAFPQTLSFALQLTSQLRNQKVNCELYLDLQAKLQKQLKYANRKKIPWVIIAGPDEVKKNQVILKNMATGQQQTLSSEKLVPKILNSKF